MHRLVLYITYIIALASCMENNIEDIAVIGGGLMGSATAWQLTRQGRQVLLLEQQDSVYTYGSSFGDARISRALGEEDDIFAFLQQTSVRETEALITTLNTFEGGHTMDQVYTTSPVTYMYYHLDPEDAASLLAGQNLRTEYAEDKIQARDLFDMSVPDSMSVIREFKDYSGTLNPKALISKLHRALKLGGGEISYGTEVIAIDRVPEGYRIEVLNTNTQKRREIICRQVVCAAGPYTGPLLQQFAPEFNKMITPERLFLAFFKIDSTAYKALEEDYKTRFREFYPAIELSPAIFYTMLESIDEDGSPLIKVGGHYMRRDVSSLDSVWNMELDQFEIDWCHERTMWYLNVLGIPLDPSEVSYTRGYSCVYSLTETEVPLVTNISQSDGTPDPNFVVVGGMSGIGAKGSLAYGLIASNLLLGITDSSPMYMKTSNAMGFSRLDIR